ncbi:MAG: phosphopyruvate hydratase [Pseudomonadota bacterium]
MSDIAGIAARRCWDSRGQPTVEVTVSTSLGNIGRALAPAGASRGLREAVDLRDGGTRLGGNDVRKAVAAVNEVIGPALLGMPVAHQAAVDGQLQALDGTQQKSCLGGNAIVATSMAVLHAAAADAKRPLWQYVSDSYARKVSLPLPEIQIFGGGAHAGRRVDVQDFMVMVPGASDFDEVMEVTAEIYYAAGDLMKQRGCLAGVADEGGWWPMFDSNEAALETLVRSIELAGEVPGERVVISLDIAASEFSNQGRYSLALEDREMEASAFIDLLEGWIDSYPIVSIEDPLGEDDLAGMVEFTNRLGDRVQIVADDLVVTNSKLIEKASSAGACNALLMKSNQVGTISEAVAAYDTATSVGWRTIVSARSGETEDVTISHLSAGLGAGQLKVGSFARSERMAKWNECLRIQDAIGMHRFVGGDPLVDTWWHQRQAAGGSTGISAIGASGAAQIIQGKDAQGVPS